MGSYWRFECIGISTVFFSLAQTITSTVFCEFNSYRSVSTSISFHLRIVFPLLVTAKWLYLIIVHYLHHHMYPSTITKLVCGLLPPQSSWQALTACFPDPSRWSAPAHWSPAEPLPCTSPHSWWSSVRHGFRPWIRVETRPHPFRIERSSRPPDQHRQQKYNTSSLVL